LEHESILGLDDFEATNDVAVAMVFIFFANALLCGGASGGRLLSRL